MSLCLRECDKHLAGLAVTSLGGTITELSLPSVTSQRPHFLNCVSADTFFKAEAAVSRFWGARQQVSFQEALCVIRGPLTSKAALTMETITGWFFFGVVFFLPHSCICADLSATDNNLASALHTSYLVERSGSAPQRSLSAVPVPGPPEVSASVWLFLVDALPQLEVEGGEQ